MNRHEAIQIIADCVTTELIVCNLGVPSQELFEISDRHENFYMLGSMGLVSSIGLGLALSQNKKVIVVDGDGSILMNLGALATIAHNQPGNLIHIIIDNKAYGSTGYQKTFTRSKADLISLAKGAGIENVLHIREKNSFKNALVESSENKDFVLMVVEVDIARRPTKPIPLTALKIKQRFMSCL